MSYSYVAKYVARRRAEITAEDRDGAEGLAGFVPQAREPGAEAEVDFGDVTVELAGQLSRCFMFAFRLSCSGKGVHRVYASQAQEAFLEGHVTAFEATGGVPSRQIRYDNLSPAVAEGPAADLDAPGGIAEDHAGRQAGPEQRAEGHQGVMAL